MKKILLGITFIGSLYLYANTLDKVQKSCEEGNFDSCSQYVMDEKILNTPYKVFLRADEVKRMYAQKCIENTSKPCNQYRKFQDKTKDMPGAFFIDGLYSGESKGSVLKKKFKQRKDGHYDVMIGSYNIVDKEITKIPIVDQYFEYRATIFGSQARVKTFFTKKTEKLYAVVVEWETSVMDDAFKLGEDAQDILDKKYFKGKEITAPDLPFMKYVTWNLNERASLGLQTILTGMTSFSNHLIFIDNKYYKN